MANFLKQVVTLLFLLSIIKFLLEDFKSDSKERSLFEFNKWHVSVTNSLSNDQLLSVHCKSKDNDLGIQYLPPMTNFTWSFGETFFERTFFWCDARKDDAEVSFKVFWHDALVFYKCLGKNCVYVVRDDGVYLDRNVDEHVQNWNPV